jgi:hypothetical protein
LIALPYRAGLFVSFSDVTGGWDAQESEIQSLTSILREYSEDFCKTEFSQKVLMDCLQARAKWPGWSHTIETVPAQAERVMEILDPMFSEKEMNGFREVLIDIALAVAMAFREASEKASASGRSSLIKEIITRLTGKAKKDPLSHMNISAVEKVALGKLCKAIKYTRLA